MAPLVMIINHKLTEKRTVYPKVTPTLYTYSPFPFTPIAFPDHHNQEDSFFWNLGKKTSFGAHLNIYTCNDFYSIDYFPIKQRFPLVIIRADCH